MNIPIPKLEGYVIFNPATGLFSGGGMHPPKWRKKPKIWKSIGHLKNHLYGAIVTGYDPYILKNNYRGCAVVDITTGQPIQFDIYDVVKKHYEVDHLGRSRKIIEEV